MDQKTEFKEFAQSDLQNSEKRSNKVSQSTTKELKYISKIDVVNKTMTAIETKATKKIDSRSQTSTFFFEGTNTTKEKYLLHPDITNCVNDDFPLDTALQNPNYQLSSSFDTENMNGTLYGVFQKKKMSSKGEDLKAGYMAKASKSVEYPRLKLKPRSQVLTFNGNSTIFNEYDQYKRESRPERTLQSQSKYDSQTANMNDISRDLLDDFFKDSPSQDNDKISTPSQHFGYSCESKLSPPLLIPRNTTVFKSICTKSMRSDAPYIPTL